MHSKDENQLKEIAEYEFEYYNCEHENFNLVNKCQIFKNPKGIIYTLEGTPGTKHDFV